MFLEHYICENPSDMVPWSQMSNLQSCDKFMLVIRYPVNHTLLWKPEL